MTCVPHKTQTRRKKKNDKHDDENIINLFHSEQTAHALPYERVLWVNFAPGVASPLVQLTDIVK
jgi:hypothetical protein